MIFRLLIPLFSIALLHSCSDKDRFSIKTDNEVSIASLKSLCEGDNLLITNNISVRGIVVATDWLGELHKSAIIIDDTEGLELAIDLNDVCKELPLHSEITIQCNGLMLARIGGNIKLGVPPSGDFPLGNIDSKNLSCYIHIVGVGREITPTTKRIDEIGAEDICSFVQFNNLRICDEEAGLPWCDKIDGEVVTTFRTLVDRDGNRLLVRTLSTCLYATEKMSANEISVAGVIDYSDNRYYLRIVNKAITEL